MANVNEKWQTIEGYENLYAVSNLGNVKSLKKKINLSLIDDRYLIVNFSKGNVKKKQLVHRLVAEAFIPNPENKPCINHKDGNKHNNRVENLEWCNQSENVLHGYRTGLRDMKTVGTGFLGKATHNSKPVLDPYTGVFYRSITEAAKYNNTSFSYLFNQLMGFSAKVTRLVLV
jgi:hypothetical protein